MPSGEERDISVKGSVWASLKGDSGLEKWQDGGCQSFEEEDEVGAISCGQKSKGPPFTM